MRIILFVLLGVLLVAVASVLALGFYALFRGGEFGRPWSNKLMRLRVLLQFAAIAGAGRIVWLSQAGRSH